MLYAGLDLAKRFDFQPPTVGRSTLPVSRPPPRRSSAVALETQSRARNRQRLRLQVNREVAQRNPPRLVNECSHSAAIVSQPGDGTCSFAGLSERMMGLEPTTFCMASRRSSQLS